MNYIYKFKGKVRKGAKRGKLLGFPTANVALHQEIPEGIYASTVVFNGKQYTAATFIGAAKTFGDLDYKAESYILDFNQNLYGKWISVRLFKKIRENKKFNNPEELVAQMKKDILLVSLLLSKNI